MKTLSTTKLSLISIGCLLIISNKLIAQNGVLSPLGVSFPNYPTANRPAANGVGVGTVLYNTSDNTHQFSNGSSWLNLTGTNTLPSGTAGQTLRNNGSGWVADNFLVNDGAQVRIGTTNLAVGYKLFVGNDSDNYGILATG